MEFAKIVNGTHATVSQDKAANAILMADIDMTGVAWTPIASTALYYGTTTYADKGYTGTFDGSGHIISNLTVTGSSTADASFGLLGTLSGTVKNLGIKRFTYTGAGKDSRVGAIVGQMLNGSVVENCYANGVSINTQINTENGVAGGIAGCSYAGTVRNSYTYHVTIAAGRSGGIVGDSRGDISTTDRPGTIDNCYTTFGSLQSTQTGTVSDSRCALSDTVFANGTVTWKLNGETADGLWKQNGSYPDFTGTAVTADPAAELETATQVTAENFASLGLDESYIGYYAIANKSRMLWFANHANWINADVCGVLTADIDLSGSEWIPIGTSGNKFTGDFDGRGYAISGLSMTATIGGTYGLFGDIANTTVKNFSVSGAVESRMTAQESFFCGVIGYAANTTVSNVHSSVNLELKDSYFKNGVAGIVGAIENTVIDRCSFSGELDFGTADIDCGGGIVGYASYNQAHVITNCAFYGTIHSDSTTTDQIGGILGYYRGQNIRIKNCLSVGTINLGVTTYSGMIGGRVLQIGAANLGNLSNNYYDGAKGVPAFAETTTGDYADSEPSDYEGYGDANAAAVTTEQLATGEIAYMLNGDQSSIVWYQTCGEGLPAFSGKTVYRLTEGDGTYLYSNTLETHGCQVGEVSYYSLQKAIAAANDTIIKLLKDTDQSATVTADLILDLNGFAATGTVTVTSGTLYGMDSTATKTTAGSGSVKVVGNVGKDQIVDDVRYIALETNGVYTFHVLEMQLTAVSLRTSEAGIYYKAALVCDPILTAAVGSYGVVLSTEDMPGTDFAAEETDGYTVQEGAPVSGKVFTSGSVFGIFKEGLAENSQRGKVEVYANAYLKLTDGTVLMSDITHGDQVTDEGFHGVAVSLQDVLTALDASYSKLSTAQQNMLKTFYNTWKTAMADWSLPNLVAAAA